MYFQIVKNNRTGRWHARIRGANHEIVFSTQTYDSKASAINSSWTFALAPAWTLGVAPPAVGCCWC
jgi:hypothetical protein